MVEINGKTDYLFVDSGTTSPIMSYELAVSFGLLEQIVEYRLMNVVWWDKRVKLRIGMLRNVPVKFQNSITLLVDFCVYPKECKIPFLLDNGTLRRYGAVQTFGKQSKIYFQRYNNAGPPVKIFEFVLKAYISKAFTGPPIGMLVDTGSYGFNVSEKFVEAMQEIFPNKPIKRAKILFNNGKKFFESNVTVVPKLAMHMVMGLDILEDNNCTMDYLNQSLYFQREKRTFVTGLHEIS